MRPTHALFSQLSAHPRRRTTAFVGLGRMGFEMAYNLFSKTLVESGGASQFVVCDARQESAHAFASNMTSQFPGAKLKVVTTPAEAVQASQTIITMLPSSPHVRQVYTDTNGIVPALRSLTSEEIKATLLIDSTTLDVQVARETAAEVHEVGATMVDAPVSGGVAGAKAGTLSFFGWRNGGRFLARISHPFSHGQANHPLWTEWFRAGREDL